MRRLAIAVTLAVATVANAHAGVNLVTNGGFETGDFTGWTRTGDTTFNGVQCPGPSSSVFAGNCSAFFGPVGTTGGISQTVNSLVVGTVYHVHFAFQPDGGTPSSFSASFGGQTLVSITNPPGAFLGPYQLFSFDVTATASSAVLAFSFRDDPGFLSLDAVSVDTPEPATLALLSTGLLGIAAARRRKAF